MSTLIVDELHAVADDKRGSHLSISMERLVELSDEPITRIGLSATQNPIEEIGRFLVGVDNTGRGREARLHHCRHRPRT